MAPTPSIANMVKEEYKWVKSIYIGIGTKSELYILLFHSWRLKLSSTALHFAFIIINIDLNYNIPIVLFLFLVRCLVDFPIPAETHPVTSYGSLWEVEAESLEV
jgi:hypothetical protein